MESLHITDAVKIDENLNRPGLYFNIIQNHIGDKFRGGVSAPVDRVVEELDPGTKKPVKRTLVYFDSIATLGFMLFHLRRLLVVAGYPSTSVKHGISQTAAREPKAEYTMLSLKVGAWLYVQLKLLV